MRLRITKITIEKASQVDFHITYIYIWYSFFYRTNSLKSIVESFFKLVFKDKSVALLVIQFVSFKNFSLQVENLLWSTENIPVSFWKYIQNRVCQCYNLTILLYKNYKISFQ